MTNFEYIISHLTERDIATILPYSFSEEKTPFINKIYKAWEKWALSFSPNTGNMAKGSSVNNKETIKNNPSIWFWEEWFMPDGTKEKKGRTRNVSIQVWLSLQYNSKDWE